MSALTDQAKRIEQFQDRVDKSIEGLQADIESLQKLVQQLQNTPGAITPEDQALLDNIEGRAQKIADKVEALDALEPGSPSVPPVP